MGLPRLYSRVNLDRLYLLLLNTIKNDARAIGRGSDQGRINRFDAQTIVSYIKLMKQLRKAEDDEDPDESGTQKTNSHANPGGRNSPTDPT